MFIIVKYGHNESLLCNPSCAVVNLLKSIKSRAGYGHTNLILDLSDESGLIKDLDVHKNEYATSLLSSHATYVLLQKDPIEMDDNQLFSKQNTLTNPATRQFTYTALLEHTDDHFPNFRLHVAEMEEKMTKPRTRSGSKTPSPAGRLFTKPAKKNQLKMQAAKRK